MKNAYLWKRVLNEGVDYNLMTIGDREAEAEKLTKAIITSHIIVDSLPVEHQEGIFEWAKYKSLTWPFRSLWIECATPKEEHVGVLFEVNEYVKGFYDVTAAVIGGCAGTRVTVVGLAKFPTYKSGTLILGKDGSFPAIGALNKNFFDPRLGLHGKELGGHAIYCALSNAFDVLELLGCKNVSLKPHENEPNAVSRAVKRNGGTPESYRYHTLIVRTPGSKSDSDGVDIGIMPRHVCRGHFAEYGPKFNKGLLFGKYEGRFFVPPHMKGDKKNGIVEKDYLIKG